MKKSTKTIIASLILCLICIVAAFGIKSCQDKQKNDNVLKIGAILPLTGSVSDIGEGNKAGIELALEKVNADGKKIEVYFEDGKGDATTSMSAMKKLKLQGVDVFILSTTQTVAPILQNYKEDSNLLFSAVCQTKGILDDNSNAFRLYFTSENETTMMANHIVANGYKKIAVFRLNTESCLEPIRTMQQKVSDLNYEADYYEQIFEFSDMDYKTYIANIKNYNPDLLVVYSYPKQWQSIVRQLVEQNVTCNIMGNSGFGQTAENDYFKDLDIMNNIVFPAPYFVINKDNDLDLQQVIKDLKDKYHLNADWNILYLYDNIMVLADNLQYADNKAKMLKNMCSKEYKGLTGAIAFDEKNDIKSSDLQMVKIVKGKYIQVQ